ncbi:MAG: hypothetical protein CML60_01605 [Rhodobacteraceae bacterium]|nr:hypothetical protein [Paracoccaceae bacterium]
MIDDRSSRAAAYVHEESSYMSKRMFQESIDSGRNTQLDGTGDSSMEKLRSKVASAREASSSQGGTKVIADYITIDTDEAVRRARRRAIQTGRSVPEEVVRNTHASISKIFPDILDENLFDDIKLWDTAFDPPKLILRKVDGVLEIYDEAAYERFLLKNADYQGAGVQAGVEPILDSKSRVFSTIDGDYDPLRKKQVHEPFYEKNLAKGVATDEPDVVILGGGPASGKSTIIKSGDVELPEGHVMVNPDDAKEVIPEYSVIIENGDDWAAAYVHEESSDMAKELMARSIRDESMPTVLDGTGDSSFAKLTRKVETAREQAKGGRIIGEYVTVDTDVAVKRAIDRGKREGRKVPREVVEGTHESVSRVFPQAAEADLFDELRLWDTNSGKPVLIYEKVDGVENIIDRELYERFLRKNPDYVPPVSDAIESLRPVDLLDEEITAEMMSIEDQLGISLPMDDAGNYAGTPAYYADDVPIRVETGTSYADEVEVLGSFKERKETLDVALEMVDSAFAPTTSGIFNRPKKVEFRYTASKPKGKDGLGGSYRKKKYPDRPKRVAKPARIKTMIPEVTSNLDEWAKQRSYALGEPIAALDVATGLPATVNGKIAYVHDNMAEQAKQYRHVATRLEELNERAMQDSALFELYGYESAEEMMEEYYSYWYAQAERLEEIDVYDRGYIGEAVRYVRLRPGTKGSRINSLVHEIGHDFDYTQTIELVLVENKEKLQLSPNDSNAEIIFDLYKKGKITKASVGEQGLAYIEFMENVVESKAYKKLLSKESKEKMLSFGMSEKQISDYLQYATSPKEVWARAFNQWTTTRHGRNAPDAVFDMMSEGVDTGDYIGFQWDPEDFDTMVAPYLEKIFKANGWVE